jgi:hypothetical protein
MPKNFDYKIKIRVALEIININQIKDNKYYLNKNIKILDKYY